MPKSIIVEPKEAFSRSRIHLSDIPVNAYDYTVEDELAHYSTEGIFAHLAGHVRHSGIRDNPERNQDQGRI